MRRTKQLVLMFLTLGPAYAVPTSHIDGFFSQNNWQFKLEFTATFDDPVDFITIYADGHPGWYSNITPTTSVGGGVRGVLPPDFDPSWIYGYDMDHTISYNFLWQGQTYLGPDTFTYHIHYPAGPRPDDDGNFPPTGVPDGGSSLALLGIALGALAYKRA